MFYSFLHSGLYQSFSSSRIPCTSLHLQLYMIKRPRFRLHNMFLHSPYTISLVNISSKSFFLSNLKSIRPFLKRWPKETPFDFEKKLSDLQNDYLLALPSEELFVSIDDDHDNIGYSLISRGEYPDRLSRSALQSLESTTFYHGISSIYFRIPHQYRRSIRFISRLVKRFIYTISYYI